MNRVIVGGVGYRNLRDHSVGIVISDLFKERSWPEYVSVEDFSYNPIALLQRLTEEPEATRFRRAVVVSAISRKGRAPGTVEAYRWNQGLPSPEAIQAAVAEAVTGVISLDNTLVVIRYFGGLPEQTAVVEVEPQDEEFGDGFSLAVANVFESVCELVSRLAVDPAAVLQLVEAPLGGPRHGRAEFS